MTADRLNERRRRLQARLDELEALNAQTASDRKPVELDQASVGRLSRMDAMQQQAMAQASGRNRLNEVKRIRAALIRMEEDEYGYCVMCGDAIAAKRLDIDPTIATCINCASD